MKNILVLTDFSSSAWNATKFALSLFEGTNCVFYFLNTYTPEINSNRLMAGIVSNLPQTAALSSRKGLKSILQRVKKNYKNPLHSYKTISSFSLLKDEVKEMVTEHKIDFIVMGANGSSDNELIFMGKNTVRILNTIHNCPVLAIPKCFDFKKPNTITFVSNFNHFYRCEELDPIVTLATISHSSVRIVTIQDKSGQLPQLQKINHEMIDKKLETVSHSFHNLMVVDSYSTSIEQFIEQAKCQLLVMSNITNSYIKGICRELVIDRSTFYSEVPVLLLQGIENA